MRSRFYLFLVLLVVAVSCGEYDKILKSTDYDLKKAKAKEYYDAGQYVKSSEILTQILPRFRGSLEAEDLSWMNAQSYYGMKDYYMAGTYYKAFVDQFPFGAHAEEANFMAALCDYKVSPNAELDQTNTQNAIEGFRIFINKYPNSSKIEECKKYIKDLEETLVEKSYLNAKLYYDMKNYKSAVIALNNSLKEYANTKYREEMMFLKLNSLFQYAELSFKNKQKERYQATLDDYYSFMEEFPKSTYSKEVNNIFQKTNRFLKAGLPESGSNTNGN